MAKANLPKNESEFMIRLTTLTQNELGPDATQEEVAQAVMNKLTHEVEPLHNPPLLHYSRKIGQGITYDLLPIPGGPAKGKYFLKALTRGENSFANVCQEICDKSSATDSDILMGMDLMFHTGVKYLSNGLRFPLYNFGELTVNLAAKTIPEQYDGTPKDIFIKSVDLIPSKTLLHYVNEKGVFTRDHRYPHNVLPKDLRLQNILDALTQKPYLQIQEICNMNRCENTTAVRDMQQLIKEKKAYRFSRLKKYLYALYPETKTE